MKKLFKNLPMVLMVMALSVACGKENSSGGSSSPSTNPDDIVADGIGNASQNYQSIEEVRERFDSKSMKSDLPDGTEMYHVGTFFGAKSSGSSGGIQLSVSGCLFGLIGDCDETQGTNYIIQNMLNYINQGRVYRVVGADSNSVTGEKAIDVDDNGSYVYQDLDLSKNSTFYKQMLHGSSNSVQPTAYLAPAKVTLKDGSVIEAVAIQNQYGYFVVSSNLPVAANPIFAYGPSGIGALSNIGQSVVVKKIESQQMGISYSFYGR